MHCSIYIYIYITTTIGSNHHLTTCALDSNSTRTFVMFITLLYRYIMPIAMIWFLMEKSNLPWSRGVKYFSYLSTWGERSPSAKKFMINRFQLWTDRYPPIGKIYFDHHSWSGVSAMTLNTNGIKWSSPCEHVLLKYSTCYVQDTRFRDQIHFESLCFT